MPAAYGGAVGMCQNSHGTILADALTMPAHASREGRNGGFLNASLYGLLLLVLPPELVR